MLQFVINLPGVGAADVVERRLTVTIGAGEPQLLNPATDATESIELSGNDNEPVHAELVDVDDAGNVSQPSTLDAILADTLPPPAPGAMGITVTGEEAAPPV